MQLSTIFVGLFLSIILVWKGCLGDLYDDHPLRACAKAILSGNEQKCFDIFLNSSKENEKWSKDEVRWPCADFQCVANHRGYFLKLEWVWEGRYRCDTKAPGIVGYATKKSRSGATLWAFNDLIMKAVATGRFKEKDFRC